MVLKLEDKKAIVAEVAVAAKEASSLVAFEYEGLPVSELDSLRRTARQAGVRMSVVRNTLARRALQGTQFDCLQDSLVGPLILAFSKEHPGAAARLIKEFAKKNTIIKVRAIALDRQLLPPSSLDQIASLPTREEGIAQLMAVMIAPVSQFVRTLVAPQSKLVRTLAAIRDQKQTAA